MEYKGQTMRCDGDSAGYPYNACNCVVDYVNCADSTTTAAATHSTTTTAAASTQSGASQKLRPDLVLGLLSLVLPALILN